MDHFVYELYDSLIDFNIISKMKDDDFENIKKVYKIISQMRQILDKT